MKQEYRFSVEVLVEVDYNTYKSTIVHQTDCRESAEDVAAQRGGTVIDHHMTQEDKFMELHSWNINRVYDDLDWYITELVKATQDPSTPHHHITYLSGKIASKTESLACSIKVVQEQSQRKADKE